MSFCVTPFGLFHVSLLPAFFLNTLFVTVHTLGVRCPVYQGSLPTFVISSPNLPVAVSIGFVRFHTWVLKSPITAG